MEENEPGGNLTRRDFIVNSSAAGLTAIVVSGAALMCSKEAWALKVTHLKPETMQTIIQLARDIYPHDKVADRFYAVACKSFDSADLKDNIEEGVAFLNQLAKSKFKKNYTEILWESERVSLLKEIENTPMFQAMRGSLVTGLYNQKEIWPIFGYQGASYPEGGYIDRGFDDIDWL